MLRHVGCFWLKFENDQILDATFVDVAWCCSRFARFVQQCCTWACALVRFSTHNMLQHVPTWWPNDGNMLRPTKLLYVALKCCDRLAGTCKYWANNVAICWVERLRSFGRGSILKKVVSRNIFPATASNIFQMSFVFWLIDWLIVT